MTDGTGTTSYSYDSLGRVTSITDGAGVKVGYGYDLNGNLTSLTYPNGQTAAQNYSYTQLGQLASDNGASYGYDPAGDMTQVAGGTQQTFNAGSELQSATVPGTAKPAATDKVVSANVSGKTGKLTSPAVTTKEASDLVLAFVAANGPARTTQRVTKLAGGGLKWSLVVRSNARQGTAEVWQAHASSRLKKAKITATLRFKGFDGSITIAAFTGAGLTAGAHAAASGKTHAPAISLTTTGPDSLVWAAGEDPHRATARKVVAGQSLVHQYLDTKGKSTAWVQASGPTPTGRTGTPSATLVRPGPHCSTTASTPTPRAACNTCRLATMTQAPASSSARIRRWRRPASRTRTARMIH